MQLHKLYQTISLYLLSSQLNHLQCQMSGLGNTKRAMEVNGANLGLVASLQDYIYL